MTEQSTPTPPEQVEMIAVRKRVQAVIDGTLMSPAIKSAQIVLMIRAAGWKSPAEVAELVRAAEHTGFVRATQHTLHLVSEISAEYGKPTTYTTEVSNV